MATEPDASRTVGTIALRPAPRRPPVRAAIYGTGKIGSCFTAASVDYPDLDIVAGVTTSKEKVGRDLGELAGIAPIGVKADDDLDAMLARDDVDLVFYCGLGEPAHVGEHLGRFVDAGKDAITVSGMIHPVLALGADGAAALAGRAERGGARIVGAGWNPGFILDALAVMVADSCVRIDLVSAQRIAEMRDWGRGVHEECGLGMDASKAKDSPNNPLHESVALIGDALGLELDRIENTYEPYLTVSERQHHEMRIAPGSIAGFHKRSRGFHADVPRVDIEMFGIFCIGPDDAGLEEGSSVRVEGDAVVATQVTGDWFGDSYPVTAYRAIRAVRPLRSLAPGLYRPDQLPLSG